LALLRKRHQKETKLKVANPLKKCAPQKRGFGGWSRGAKKNEPGGKKICEKKSGLGPFVCLQVENWDRQKKRKTGPHLCIVILQQPASR